MSKRPKANPRLKKLLDRPGYMMRRCLQASDSRFALACAELDMTPRQYDVLYLLDGYDTLDQDQIGRALGLDPATAGMVSGILERKGLIRRRIKESDKRKRTLTITASGRRAYESAKPAAQVGRESLLSPFSREERDQFLSLLRRVLDARDPSFRRLLEEDWVSGEPST